MNHKFASTPVKAMAVISAAALLIAGNPSSGFANPGKEKSITRATEEALNVQYLGVTDNSFVFHVQFDNPGSQKFSVIVKNEAGIVVYQEQFTASHFSKNFRLPNEGDDMRPTFVVRSGKQQIERSFRVNTKVTQNVEVTRL